MAQKSLHSLCKEYICGAAIRDLLGEGPGPELLPWRFLIPLSPSLSYLVWKLMQVLEPSSANMKPSLSSLSELGD